MTWLSVPDLILILSTGAALGLFGGLFGIGGGLIAVPLFVLWLGMDQAHAQGTALVLMVPNLILGFIKYRQRLSLPWQDMALLAVSATATTWLFAQFALLLDPDWLKRLFSVFLVLVGLKMSGWSIVRRSDRQSGTPEQPLRRTRLPWVGLAGGSSMGLLGMGGGLVATPLLTGWLKQRQAVAQGLSLALVTPCSIVALIAFANAHKVNWEIGLPMAAGGMATVAAGVGLAQHLPDHLLKRFFAGLMVLAGMLLLLR